MNFEKTAKSFNMHFGKDCEKICFSGMSIPFLSGADTSLCGAVSIGGCLALSNAATEDLRRNLTIIKNI